MLTSESQPLWIAPKIGMKYCGEYQGSVRTTTSRVYVRNTAAAAPMHVRICASIPCSHKGGCHLPEPAALGASYVHVHD